VRKHVMLCYHRWNQLSWAWYLLQVCSVCRRGWAVLRCERAASLLMLGYLELAISCHLIQPILYRCLCANS
jgi:hypothetical protein